MVEAVEPTWPSQVNSQDPEEIKVSRIWLQSSQLMLIRVKARSSLHESMSWDFLSIKVCLS